MHWTLATIACLVAWALLGGLWRRGSIALAASWGVGQVAYLWTGNSLPIETYWILDPLVIYAVWVYGRSKLDYTILAAFPACWVAYVFETGQDQWWTLWVITCFQLFLAGPIPQIQRIRFAVSHGPRRANV